MDLKLARVGLFVFLMALAALPIKSVSSAFLTAHAISGRIARADGEPLAGALVIAQGEGISTTTDAEGRYTLNGLSEGTHALVASMPGLVFAPPSRVVTVPPDQTGQDFTATPGYTTFLPHIVTAAATPLPSSGWREVPSPTTELLAGVALSGPNDGWVVGRGAILRLRNGTWSQVDAPLTGLWFLSSVALSGPDDGWAVGSAVVGEREQGIILRLSGGQWSQVAAPVGGPLNDIALSGPNDGWAVGDLGSAVLRLSGGQWSVVNSATSRILNAVALSGPDSGWAVGDDGMRIYLDSGQWSGGSTGWCGQLFDVALTGRNEGWAVGSSENGGPCALRYMEGQGWQPAAVPALGENDLRGIALSSRDEGWAVGTGGVLLRLQAGAWRQVVSPTQADLNDIALSGPNHGWAVGRGTILRLSP